MCQSCIATKQPADLCEQAPIYQSTGHFSDIERRALQLANQYGPEKVLLVKSLQPTKSLQLSTGINSLPDLLEAQRLLYDVSAMSAPETSQSKILQRLQQRGLYKIMLPVIWA